MEPLEARERREAVNGSVTVWRPWQLKQLDLSEGRAVTTPSIRHFFQEYVLVCMQSGVAHYRYRNTRVSGQAVDGTLLVIEPGETWISQAKDVTYHSLCIDPAWLQQLTIELFHREQSLPHFPSHYLFDPSLSQAVRDLAARSQAPTSCLQQEEMLLHLLARLLLSRAQDAGAFREPGWEHPVIKRTKAYLQAHYAEEVKLRELADVVNLSPFHLARSFRQAVGLPPHAYQTHLRLEHAKKLLAHGYDVGYVAHETGFFDQPHFTQQFKRHYLVTPGSYRKTARFSKSVSLEPANI
ncbi:AraC family transcriptional regulator [Ktedonosporobacter rubrisoli]|uniref:AraC family transcriptional regulator n=1 Tax=Ktedonosporobacter rubrisoli TaxID=2509675 RepID=A0A4P6JKE3_KTERU|nr:AraC family transcriptional regulator [Ktedonosporobacter rubrisoli]QBD75440.1 AraC family transcriptional regulator [Ktedonosporobacter rubrisoli]